MLFALFSAAVGAEVGLDILLTAVGADPCCWRFGLFGTAFRAELGENARLAAGRAGPAGIGLRLLAAALRAELRADILCAAGRTIPSISGLRFRFSAAAVGAEAALNILRPAIRALPALGSRGCRHRFSAHVRCLEALHHVADLRSNSGSCGHADAETQQISENAASTAAGRNRGTHVADPLGVGFLHLGLKHVLLTVALCGHDLGLGETGKPLSLCLGLGCNDSSLGFAPGNFRFRGLLLQHRLTVSGLDGGGALFLRSAELRLALGLSGLDRGLGLIDAGLE